ncbi:MAG: hypothetical protein ACTHJ0_13805 [Flavipsychrobacter sp.]
MPHAILNEPWSEYDDRKIKDGRDRNKFSCTEEWEKEYLINKISRIYPNYSRAQIRTAIEYCCTYTTDRQREPFVRCVMQRLRS